MENAKRSALQRMRKVIKVCEDAVRSEFPSFDGMMAFHVFNLKEDVGCPTSSGLQDMISSGQRHFHKPCEGESLERLALIFEVSRDKLIAEFEYRAWSRQCSHEKCGGFKQRVLAMGLAQMQWQEGHDNFGTSDLHILLCFCILFFNVPWETTLNVDQCQSVGACSISVLDKQFKWGRAGF